MSTKDLGLHAVERAFEAMQIDAEWSVREARGFTWWGAWVRERIWADKAVRSRGETLWHVRARTPALRDVPDEPATYDLVNTLNGLVSLSAYAYDPDDRTVSARCGTFLYRDVAGWLEGYFVTAAALGASVAWGQVPPQADGRALDDAPHPVSGSRKDPDDMLNLAGAGGPPAPPIRTSTLRRIAKALADEGAPVAFNTQREGPRGAGPARRRAPGALGDAPGRAPAVRLGAARAAAGAAAERRAARRVARERAQPRGGRGLARRDPAARPGRLDVRRGDARPPRVLPREHRRRPQPGRGRDPRPQPPRLGHGPRPVRGGAPPVARCGSGVALPGRRAPGGRRSGVRARRGGVGTRGARGPARGALLRPERPAPRVRDPPGRSRTRPGSSWWTPRTPRRTGRSMARSSRPGTGTGSASGRARIASPSSSTGRSSIEGDGDRAAIILEPVGGECLGFAVSGRLRRRPDHPPVARRE